MCILPGLCHHSSRKGLGVFSTTYVQHYQQHLVICFAMPVSTPSYTHPVHAPGELEPLCDVLKSVRVCVLLKLPQKVVSFRVVASRAGSFLGAQTPVQGLAFKMYRLTRPEQRWQGSAQSATVHALRKRAITRALSAQFDLSRKWRFHNSGQNRKLQAHQSS